MMIMLEEQKKKQFHRLAVVVSEILLHLVLLDVVFELVLSSNMHSVQPKTNISIDMNGMLI